MLFLLIGIVAGVALGYFICMNRNGGIAVKYEMSKEENKRVVERMEREHASQRTLMESQYEKRLSEQKTEMRERYEQIISTKDKANAEALAAQELRHRESVASMQARFDEAMQKMSEQMKVATNEMLKQRQKEFAETSNTNIGQIVTPLRETIDQMKRAMDESTLKQTAMSSEMKANIENMMRQSEAAKQSADELARVFKHKSKLQGDWGETVLNELLTSQGLINGIHYTTQATMRDSKGNVVKSEEGSMLRPDVIMHLDTKRELIIDSKVSLTAFFDYVNAESDVERDAALKAHVDSVNKHVKELATKDYSKYIQSPKVKMDYVIMFMPHSGALWTALNAQPDLWRKAMEMNVFIADEQTLFAALKIINLTWTQITQVQQHERVYELAEQMIDRVGQFVKKYEVIGQSLERAQKAYDEAGKKLSDQGQSIIVSANNLIKLGAKNSGKNPVPQIADIEMS